MKPPLAAAAILASLPTLALSVLSIFWWSEFADPTLRGTPLAFPSAIFMIAIVAAPGWVWPPAGFGT